MPLKWNTEYGPYRKTREFVAYFLEGEPSSHDMSHINRVEALCLEIQKEEGGNPLILHLAALLHDVGVIKEHEEGGDHALYSAEIASEFLGKTGLEKEIIEAVTDCILTHRFSGEKSLRLLKPGFCRMQIDLMRLER